MPKVKGPTDKERAFVENYLACWNISKAARDAGYSEKSARSTGRDILQKPYIRSLIEERLRDAAMSADEVLARLTSQARANISDFLVVDEDGFAHFDFTKVEAEESLHAVKKIRAKRSRRVVGRGEDAEEWEDESVEVEMYDAQHALEILGKHHKIYEEAPTSLTLTIDERTQKMLDKIYGTITKPQS